MGRDTNVVELWFGVIRRALIGDILRRLNIDAFYTYANFFYFSHVILLLQLLLIFYWFKYCLRYISNGGIYLSHWFASLAIVVHIHFVGYLDNILIFIMVGVALLPFYPALMLALCIIGTLCHELFYSWVCRSYSSAAYCWRCQKHAANVCAWFILPRHLPPF